MGKVAVVVSLSLFFILSLVGTSFALDLIGQDPTMNTYVVGVDENLYLIFDASLNPTTVTSGNVKVLLMADGSEVAATLSVTTTVLADDTIIIAPGQILEFGRLYEFVISSGLEDTFGVGFSGLYPFGEKFVCNIPNDLHLPDYSDPLNFDALTAPANALLGFDPIDPENTDEDIYWRIPGMSITEAWKFTTGRADVLVGIIDDGMETYDDEEVRTRLFINVGELPLPDVGGAPCAQYDCNSDGRINIEDYENDSRLLAYTGGGLPHVGDCIELFSDGVDDDGNGFVDDISGWDFFRNVNVALGVEEFPEGTHGGGRAREIAGIANDNQGSYPGICSDCMVLPIRVSEAVLADYNIVAAGIEYATSMGSKIISVAMGSFNYNQEAHLAVLDAYDDGVLVVAASGDELGFHHIYPGAGEDVLTIKSIFPFPPMDLLSIFPLETIAFTESYCTNFGPHVDLTIPAGHICTSEAVGLSTGIGALIISRGLDLGFDLGPNEVKQLMTMTADDIKNRCVTLLTEGRCQPGFDEHFGYGRVNAIHAIERLGNPDAAIPHTIPPVVRLTSPKWWQPFNPLKTPTLTVTGQLSARAPGFHYQLEFARGVEPLDGEFEILSEGDSSTPIDGDIFTINLGDLISPGDLRRQAVGPNDKTVTFRLRAYWMQGGEKIWGEARKAVTMFIDDDPNTGLVDGFPINLGASGESSVVLYDLIRDEDGYLEIIFATSDGQIHVFNFDPNADQWTEAAGFPVDVSGDSLYFAESIIASVVVGDLLGNGSAQIVTATNGGKVYAIWSDGNNHQDGPFMPGFPVSADEPLNDTPYNYGHGNAFLASPVLSDLDLDGQLEIIAAGYDQKAYAWKVDDGQGQAGLLSGWPVLLSSRSEDGLVPPFKQCQGNPLPAQVLGSPAVFIIDPEHIDPDIGEHPSVVVGTSEACESALLPSSRIYAVYWNGMDHQGGPFLPDWPATPLTPLGDAIPIPPLTVGITNSPAATYIDGETLISVGGFFWFPSILKYEGGKLETISLPTQMNVATSANGTFAPIMGDDEVQFILPTMGFLNRLNGKVYATSFNIVAWDLREEKPTLLFKKKMDDALFFVNPVVADLNGDYIPEVIAGSGGNLLHAFNFEGEEPKGFPKMTGHWNISSPAIADIDRDGLLEVVMITHEGYLFAWETEGYGCHLDGRNGSWPTYRHDEHNSGFLSHDATSPAMITDLDARITDDDSYKLYFTASGDDHLCGTVAGYDIRYSTDPQADLANPEIFAVSPVATASYQSYLPGGNDQTLTINMDEQAKVFAVRAYDEQGHLSQISNASTVRPDDESDDDDDPGSGVGGLADIAGLPGPVIDEGEDIGCGC